ncbi:MAG TPA: DUF3857 and transglutaminase domain-containing protein, partial [Chitinophagales bacterium]|nr:DUF3857 and transglutaminase domain-containing protein [Chitinophagales bacterium]
MVKRCFLFVGLLGLMGCLYAGGPVDKKQLDEARAAFPDADAIFLQKNMDLTIDYDKGDLKISAAVDEQVYFPTDQSDFYRKYEVYHSYFSDINDLQASTYVNNNGKYKELKVSDFSTADNVDANIFYDDLKEINFIFPGVTPGSVGKLSYNEVMKDPHFIPAFYFISYMPVMNSTYTITCPNSVKINYRLFNNDSNWVSFSKEEKGKNTIYRWTAKNVRNYKSEDGAPGFAYYAPHLLVAINEYTINGETKKVIPDLDGLCQWNQSFVKNINHDIDPQLADSVKSITAGAATDEEKMRRIYYWVQDNINYVAFEDGLNGLVPREAKDVFKKRYGDCKDMASILVKMLRIAGLKAYYACIGTRSLPYKYSELACSHIDNHMICIADVGGKRYVLDGTGKFTPLGFVTEFIQGKEALIMKDDGNCEVYTIPVMPQDKTVESETITVNFADNKLIQGEIDDHLTGYYKINQSYKYVYSQPDKREEKLKSYLSIGNNKCKITKIDYQGFGGQDSVLNLKGKYELAEYSKSVGNKIYLNPNLDKAEIFDNVDMTDRKLPFEIEYKCLKKSTTIINLPEGYSLDYKPEDVTYKTDNASFSVSYKVDGNQVIQTKEISTNFLTLQLKELEEWNKMI